MASAGRPRLSLQACRRLLPKADDVRNDEIERLRDWLYELAMFLACGTEKPKQTEVPF
jgi:hypothetical protein